jgi:carbonic anhydrase
MRTFIIIAGLALISATGLAQDRFLTKDPPRTILENLKRGNSRFVGNRPSNLHKDSGRRELSVQREPSLYALATILSCTDSRVPVELIFDVGVMDVCVHRTPGNTCTEREAAGIEYDLKRNATPVIIVMGHSDCNLIEAALDPKTFDRLPPNQQELVKPILPVAERVKQENPYLKERALSEICTRENVMESIHTLFRSSPDILELSVKNKILVVGAVYDVKTGRVAWIEHRQVWNLMNSVNDARKNENK